MIKKKVMLLTPNPYKVILVPFGMVSMTALCLWLMIIFSLLMGVLKVGLQGVSQSLMNQPNVVKHLLIPWLVIAILQVVIRVLLLRKNQIKVRSDSVTVYRVFSKQQIKVSDVAEITERIRYLSFSNQLKLTLKNGERTTIYMSYYTKSDTHLVSRYLLQDKWKSVHSEVSYTTTSGEVTDSLLTFERLDELLANLLESTLIGNTDFFRLNGSSGFIQTIFDEGTWVTEYSEEEGYIYRYRSLEEPNHYFYEYLSREAIDISQWELLDVSEW